MNKRKLYELKKDMIKQFTRMKQDPMNMNLLMEHVTKMSLALDTLIDGALGDHALFDLHMEMLTTVPYGYKKQQVADIGPWKALGPTIKAGFGVDLAELAAIRPHKLWFWSDQHFGHKNIISFSNRPFGDLDHMHHQLLANYKKVIGEDDVVVWIGDVSFAGTTATNEWLKEFPGYKILVVGNHDIDHGKLKNFDFHEVHTSLSFGDFIVTHHPWVNMLPHNMWNIHGHMHDRPFSAARHACACVEMINYTPITFKDLVMKAGYNVR